MFKTNKHIATFLITICLFFFCCGFAYIYTYMPPKNEALQNIAGEGLVVFTGGSKRIAKTLDIINNGFNGPVLISGVNPLVKRENLLAEANHKDKTFIEIDYTSRTTRENVQKTLLWAQENHIQHLVLITSSYHMPRSTLLLHRAGWTGSLTRIAVRPDNLPLTFALREYIKFILSSVNII